MPKFKIGICGSHGTGKTTLANLIAKEFNFRIIQKTMRNMWENYGISDFEKLPPEVRKIFQYKAILKQIQVEDETNDNFVTDRTVLDNLVYTELVSKLSETDLNLYKALVKERLKTYTHLIYIPVEFVATSEHLRANLDSQKEVESLFRNYFYDKKTSEHFGLNDSINFLEITGTLEERMQQVREFLGKI
jgi:deoxyadenosine/deoxycytidine kinase